MKTSEMLHLTPGEVHEAINSYVKRHTGKMAGNVTFHEAKQSLGVGYPVCMCAVVELHKPPTKD